MRDLKLPVRYKATLPPTEEEWLEASQLRSLGGRISSAALALEDVIVSILMGTILKEVQEHRDYVVAAMLKTSWCSIEAKRTLLLSVADRFQLLTKEQRKKLEEDLSKVIGYRNAFAHGTLVHTGEIHELRYFRGGPLSLTINDATLEKLETQFGSAWDTLLEVEQRLERGG